MTMNNNIPCIYINGLSNNKFFSNLVLYFWRKSNMNFFFANINWFDNDNFITKKNEILLLAKSLIEKYGKLAIIGVSAGASLAINIFNDIKKENISLVLVNGRVNIGNYKNSNKNSLYSRSKINNKKSYKAFYDMVTTSDNIVNNTLLEKDKLKILVMNSYLDFIVPRNLSFIENAKVITSPTIGHNLGIFFNLILFKNKTLKFINSNLHDN